MMAIVGDVPVSRSDLLLKFRCLSVCGKVKRGLPPGHEDGWGILSYRDDSPEYIGRSTDPAWKDAQYEVACRKVTNADRIVLAHIRKRSSGGNPKENTQPLVYGRWSLGHNGTIYTPSFNTVNGRSDSQVLLDRLVKRIEAGEPNMAESLIAENLGRIRDDILREAKGGRAYSSLTLMVSDGRCLYVLRDFTDDADDDYYTMYYRRCSESVVFCQERILEGAWESLDNRELVIATHDGQVRRQRCD
jgi:predicted glutamine amidotransferase